MREEELLMSRYDEPRKHLEPRKNWTPAYRDFIDNVERVEHEFRKREGVGSFTNPWSTMDTKWTAPDDREYFNRAARKAVERYDYTRYELRTVLPGQEKPQETPVRKQKRPGRNARTPVRLGWDGACDDYEEERETPIRKQKRPGLNARTPVRLGWDGACDDFEERVDEKALVDRAVDKAWR